MVNRRKNHKTNMANPSNDKEDEFKDTHTDDDQVLDYVLRNVRGSSPISGEPIDGIPDVDAELEALNS